MSGRKCGGMMIEWCHPRGTTDGGARSHCLNVSVLCVYLRVALVLRWCVSLVVTGQSLMSQTQKSQIDQKRERLSTVVHCSVIFACTIRHLLSAIVSVSV